MVSARGRPLISPPHFAFFILSFIAAAHGTRHTTHNSEKCRLPCYGPNMAASSYGLEDGYKYKYTYEGSSKMRVGASLADLSPLDLTATVSITPIQSCAFHLNIEDVRLQGSDKKILESGYLRGGENGVIFGLGPTGTLFRQLCAQADQSVAYTNLQRAVLSLLQSHILEHSADFNSSRHQTDIFGVCRTDYTINKNSDDIQVLSRRNLDDCAYREESRLPLIVSPYNTKSEFSRSGILKGTQVREQKFVNKILKEAKSHEFYTLAPLSDESAAKVTVTSKLSLVRKVKATIERNFDDYQKISVLFENKNDETKSTSFEDIKTALKKLSEEPAAVVRESNPREFNSFVEKLAGAKKHDINNLMMEIKEGKHFKHKTNAWRILLDGLVESGSSASVEIMSELLTSGDVKGHQARRWLMSFPNTKTVTKEALLAVKEVLENGVAPVQANLGIGALVGKFCIQHDCKNLDIVDSIEETMAKILFESCSPTNIITENNLIAGLKGLGNIRYLSDKVAKRLSECAMDKEVLIRVRVAALETMKTDSKKQIIQDTAEKILKDLENDSEVRIKAYLTLTENPSSKVAEIIKDVIANEKSNQVGGFIASHLRNIETSSNPDKVAAVHHFSGIFVHPGRFGWDPKKFSRNYQLSHHSDIWGAEADANMIYSQEAYLPRSLSFNLTTSLYGNSFNLFEVGVRTENIERIYENVLRSLVLKREVVNDLVKNGTDLIDNFGNKLSHSLRPKRNVLMDKIDDTYKNILKKPKAFHDEFLFDLSVKSLGAEVGFFTHHGNDIGPHTSMDQFFNGLQYTIDNAKNLNVEYSKHSTFLEGEIVYPTGLGLPLKIKTKGGAAFGLAAEAKMDIPSLLDKPHGNHHMKLKLIPSGSVEVTGTMTVDAGNVESGVEVTLTAHSSTGGDVSVKLTGGKEVEFVVGVPLREQKIITASTGLNTIFRENSEVTSTPVELDIDTVSIEDYSGCFEQLSTLTGLTFCGELSVPNNNKPTVNPFYGPSKLSFAIHVEDESITSYLFKTSFEHAKEKNKKKINILLDTPGSRINRRIFIGYESEINPELKHAKFLMESFWKSILIEGSLIESEKELSANGKLKFKEKEYTAKAGIAMTKSSDTVTVYKPIFHYTVPQQQTRLNGRIKTSPSIKLFGEVLVERKKAEGLTTYLFNRLTLETQRSNYTIDGSVSSQCKGESSTINSDLKIIYDDEYVTINGTLSRPDATRLEGSVAVYPSQNPQVAFSVQGRLENVINQDFKFLSDFEFTHGPDPENKELRFTCNSHVLISGIREKNVKYIAIKQYVGYPPANLLISSDLDWLPRNLKYSLGLKLDQTSADLKLAASTDPAGPYDIFIAAMVMDEGFKLDLKRELVYNHKSKFTNSLEITPAKLFQVNALVNHKFIWSDLDLGIQSEIRTPLQPKHIRLSTGVQNNEEKVLGEFFLEADAAVFVDFFFERIKGPQSKGNFKLLLTDYIDSKGDFGFQDSVLKGSGFMNFLKSQSKMDAAVDMTMKYPKYVGSININWSTAEETKSFKLSTDTDFEHGILDTKNALIYNEKENQFNMKLRRTGTVRKGTFNADMEVKLGDDDHVVLKFSRNVNVVPKDSEGEYNIEMSHRATSQSNPSELVIKLVGKHVDFDIGKIDGQMVMTYASPEGKDITIQLAHKKMPKDDKWMINCLFDASGSLVENPMNLKIESELPRTLFSDSISWSRFLPPSSYRIVASFGKESNLEAYGKMTGNTFSGEISLKLPQDYKLTYFKWSTINLVQLHPGPDNKRQVKSSNVFKWNREFFEIDSEFILEKGEGSVKFDWETDKTKKRSLQLVSHWPKKTDGTLDFDVSFKYDKDGKPSDAYIKYTCNFIKGEGSFHFHGTCPTNGVYDLKIASKRFNEKKGLHTEWILVANNKTRKGLYKVISLANHPYIEFYMEDEDQAKSGFLIKADKKGVSEWTGNVHVEWAVEPGKKGFFYVNSEMKLISVDNFLIKVEANSNKYQLKDWQLEIYSDLSQQPQTTGSRNVHFKMQHDSKILLNGTALYDLNYIKEGQYRIEAKGDAMFDGSLQPISLKAIWRPSAPGKGFNGSLVHGENTISVESYFSDNEIYYVRKYCFPKHNNKCSEARIIWNSIKSGPEEEEKKLEVVLDLSSIDPTYNDIILKANFNRDRSTVDHKIELQWVKNKLFIYKAYFLHDKAGLSITLPQRTISGDMVFQLPKDVNQGRIFIEGNLWLNKIKEPNKKTYLLAMAKISRDIEEYALTTEAKLSHPDMTRELSVKGKATVGTSWIPLNTEGQFEVDVFKKPENAVILTWNYKSPAAHSKYSTPYSMYIKSKGLKIDMGFEVKVGMNTTTLTEVFSVYYLDLTGTKRETVITILVVPSKLFLSFKLPDVSMYEVSYVLNEMNEKTRLLGNYEIAGIKFNETIEVRAPRNVSYTSHFGKGNIFSMNFGLAFSEMIEFKTSLNKNSILEMGLALNEEDFLKPKFNYNNDVFRELCEKVSREATTIMSSIDKETKRALDNDGRVLALLVNKMGKDVTDLSPLFISYQKDLEAMLQEITEDEAIMQALTPLKEMLSSAIEQGVEVAEEAMKLAAHISKAADEVADHAESIILSIIAKMKETSKSITAAVSTIIESFMDAFLRFNEQIYKEMSKYDQEFQTIKTTLTEFSLKMGQHMIKFMKQVKREYNDFICQCWENIKEMPLFQLIEEKFEELKNYRFSEGFWPDIQEILKMIEDSAPNPELKRFINTVTNHIDKYLKEEKMDLDAAVRQIYTEFVAAIQPTIDSIYEAFYHEDNVFGSNFWIPLPWVSLWKAGKSTKYIRLGLLSKGFPPLHEYILHSWNSVCHILPPYKARSYISGSEIVTYDGLGISLQDGDYVLAQELTRKFSLVAEVKDSALKRIVLIQKNNSIQYTDYGELWMNGKVIEHSIKSNNGKLNARYTLNGAKLETEEVTVTCEWNLKVCSVVLRAPAFANVRGVLGTYNYEYYDEFTLPDGKIAPKKGDFINSWKIDGELLEKKDIQTHSAGVWKCPELFRSSYGFMMCYGLVNPKPFMEMCNHSVGNAHTPESKKKALCLSAYLYTRACRANNFNINIPPPCDVCEVDGSEVTTDEFKITKSPARKADIVFLVELNDVNSNLYDNLIRPLTQQLDKKLTSKGITDIEYGLIGFGSKDLSYINYFKVDGQLQMKSLPSKLPWDNQSARRFPNVLSSNATLMDKLWNAIDKYFIADDQTERGVVRTEISQSYPWRAGSSRSIVALVSSPCPLPEPALSPLTRIKIAQKLLTMKSHGIVYNLITPVEKLKLTSGKTNEVIGFTKNEAFLLNDFESGAAMGRKQRLNYSPDTCHIFPTETGGNVFVSDNLKNGNGAVDAVSTRITNSLVAEERIFHCQCSTNDGLHPKYECLVES